MKRTKDLLGLPVICIQEGKEAGIVKELLIDPVGASVEYLVIDDGQWYMGAKLLAFEKAAGIGVDAVTTDSERNIQDFKEAQDAVQFAQKNVRIIGARVFTQKGQYVGQIEEYYLNEENGSIQGCQLTGSDQKRIIPSSSIITFGRDILIVTDRVEETIVSQMEGETGRSNRQINLEHKPPMLHEEENDPFADTQAATAEVISEAVQEKSPKLESKAAKLFEKRQKQFLLGRKVSKRIINDSNQILAEEGEIITDELIDRVEANGRLIELTMNSRL